MVEAARLAVADELAEVVYLAEAARAELLPTRGGEMWARREGRPVPMDNAIADALADPDQQVQVGTVADVPVGYSITTISAMNDGELVGVISDLFVLPEARGIGIGECLLDGIVAWATQRGCAALDSLALPGNRDTKNFFETFGMKARSLTVSRPLSPSDGDHV